MLTPVGLSFVLFLVELTIKAVGLESNAAWVEGGPKIATWAMAIFFTMCTTEFSCFKQPRKAIIGWFTVSICVWVISLVFAAKATTLLNECGALTPRILLYATISYLLSGSIIGVAMDPLVKIFSFVRRGDKPDES